MLKKLSEKTKVLKQWYDYEIANNCSSYLAYQKIKEIKLRYIHFVKYN